MNWDQVEGNWKQFKGKVKEHWGKLTDDHLDTIAGSGISFPARFRSRMESAKKKRRSKLTIGKAEG